MERQTDERALSTADLADPDGQQDAMPEERGREHDPGSSPEHDRGPAVAGSDAQVDDEGADRRLAGSDDLAADRATDTESEISHDDRASLADDRDRLEEGEEKSTLFEEDQRQRLESEWESIQTGFVDEPRRAVESADTLVADLMQRLAASFAQERSQLEAQWDRGENVSTEDLRLALQRYRSFFSRLLQA